MTRRFVDLDILLNELEEQFPFNGTNDDFELGEELGYKQATDIVKEQPTINSVKQGWISVNDKLPEVEEVRFDRKFSKTVLAWTGKRVVFGYFIYYKYDDEVCFYGYDESEDRFENWTVDYWMPIPEPPERMDGEEK